METDPGILRGDPECTYKFLEARVAASVDPSASVDVACFMTTDSVDADDEVVLPSGADLSRFEKNPVLMLCHAYGQPGCYYPLPIGKVVWTKKRPNGVMAGLAFARSTAMGREIKGLFDEDMVRSFSIGFRSVEASLMTRDEADGRADWKGAFARTGGRILVHRRWQLLELSVAPIPANEDALRAKYAARGLPVPEWFHLPPAIEATMSDPAADVNPILPVTRGAVDPDAGPEAVALPSSTTPPDETGASPAPRDDAAVAGDEAGDIPIASIRAHEFVRIDAPHHRGAGRVESIHAHGLVPDVPDDVMGTPVEPAARVRCYKPMGDGYVATEHHLGLLCKHLEKTGLLPPPAPARRVDPQADEPLPPLVGLTEQQVLAEALARLDLLVRPDAIRRMVAEELEQRLGYL